MSIAPRADVSSLWRGGLAAGLWLLMALTVHAELLLVEPFDTNVPDNSPVGGIPGWHILALSDGRLMDFTPTAPNGLYPSISHSLPGAGASKPGYLVMGAGNLVSNVFAWMDCPTNLDQRAVTTIQFYTRNDAPNAETRIAVQIDQRWYASAHVFHAPGSNSVWSLNSLPLNTNATAWRRLDTNTLTVDAELTGLLPRGDISAIGILGRNSGPGKIRVDELTVHSGPVMDPAYFVGCWIWAEKTYDRQTCRFWKTIEIPQGVAVTRARLRLTADNSYRAFFDGTEFAQGSEWRRLTEYDLTLVLTPGTHVLAIEAFNEYGWAGLAAGVVVELENGRTIKLPSDASWLVIPHGQRGWTTRKTPRDDWQAARMNYQFRDLPDLPRNPVVLLPAALRPVVVHFWQRGWFQITLLSFCLVVAVVCLRLLAQLALQSKAQQVLQRERARIARDIHDDLGAGLTHLVLLGETAQQELAGDTKARAQFEKISEVGRRLVGAIDEVVWTVNSQRDSLRDFEIYICRYAENFLRARSIRCRLDVDDEIPQVIFDLATRRSLFLAIKEVLNNIAKHSQATEVALEIHITDGKVHVNIKDNGKGFDFSTRDQSRNGLTNMAQRMVELGGSFQVHSQPGAGCRIELVAQLVGGSRRLRRWWRRESNLIAQVVKQKPSA
jgi:signal transduction histidine kinase